MLGSRIPFLQRLPAMLLVVAALLVSQVAQGNKQKGRELFRKGMAEYVLGDYEAAIKKFEAGFREEPEPLFLFNIAQAHRRAKHHVEAIAYFRKFIDFAPDAAERPEAVEGIAAEEVALSTDEKAAATAAATAAAAAAKSVTAAPASNATSDAPLPVPAFEGSEAASGGDPSRAVANPADPNRAQPLDLNSAPKPVAKKRRWPLWVGLGVAAFAVAGIAVGVVIAETTPRDAPLPATSLGPINFP